MHKLYLKSIFHWKSKIKLHNIIVNHKLLHIDLGNATCAQPDRLGVKNVFSCCKYASGFEWNPEILHCGHVTQQGHYIHPLVHCNWVEGFYHVHHRQSCYALWCMPSLYAEVFDDPRNEQAHEQLQNVPIALQMHARHPSLRILELQQNLCPLAR